MRSRVHILVVAAVISTLAACRRGAGVSGDSARQAALQNVAGACRDVDSGRMPDTSAPAPREGYTSLAERDSMLRLIDAGEQKWRTARPQSYTMTVVAACFCRDRGLPLIMRVSGDSVIASRDTTGQQSWPDDWRTSLHVAGLFKEARQFTCDSTRTTRITLDQTLGYPTVLSTKSRLEVSDLDREYRVLSFTPEQ
jgi:hypothetical protein